MPRCQTYEERPRASVDRIGASSLPLDPCRPDPDTEAVWHMRRVLIYADMVARTGRIHYDRLATWDYQPTDDEARAEVEALGKAWNRRRTG